MAGTIQSNTILDSAVRQFEQTGKVIFNAVEVAFHPNQFLLVSDRTVKKVDREFLRVFQERLYALVGKGNWHYEEVLGMAQDDEVISALKWGNTYHLHPNQKPVLVSLIALKGPQTEGREIFFARTAEEEKKA